MSKFGSSNEQFTEAVSSCTSVRAVLLSLGLNGTGGNYRSFWKRVKSLGLDTSHFLGKGWSKNKHASSLPQYIPAKVFLVLNGPYIKSWTLKKKLILEGYKEERCDVCGLSNEWEGRPLSLHLHHLNGNHNDNRIENLSFLCPNCHSQTSSYSGKNKGKGSY